MAYIACVIINSILYYLKFPLVVGAYINPFVIIGSVGLLLVFANLKIEHNKTINWIAKSSFAVFLVHTNPNIGVPVFKVICNNIFGSYDGIVCLMVMFGFLVALFMGSIILDQPRIWIWKRISKYFDKK